MFEKKFIVEGIYRETLGLSDTLTNGRRRGSERVTKTESEETDVRVISSTT